MSNVCTVERVGSLETVDDHLWGAVANPGDMYQSRSWLRSLEQSDGAVMTYLIARRRGQPDILGALPLYDSGATRGDYLYWPELHFQDLLRGSALLGDRLGVLAGSCAGFGTQLILDRDAPESTRVEVMRALLDAARGVAVDRGLAYVFFLFLEPSARSHLSAAVAERGHFRLAGVAQTEVELPGKNFDDYLASLRRNVRINVRREVADYLAACSTEVVPLCDVLTCIAPMVANVRAKHGMAHDVDAVSRRLWLYHSALGPDSSKAVVCRMDGRIVGAGVLCRWNDRVYVTDFGRADSNVHNAFVYFNATMYEPIKYAYSAGLSRVVTGAGSELGKARRGSALIPLTHCALAAGDGAGLPKVDASRTGQLIDHWRDERNAHPRYFGSTWGELL